jgi:hypothetical protein
MSTQSNVVQTSVQTIETDDIDSLLFGGAPGGSNIVTPETKDEKNSQLFKKQEDTDMSFLDKDEEDEKANDPAATDKNATEETTQIDEIVDEVETADEDPKKGRPKTEVDGLKQFFKKEIEQGRMVTFDDYDEEKQTLDEYISGLGQKDLDELWEANQQHTTTATRETIQNEIFESLPYELQAAMKYVQDGGTDMKGIFRALSVVEETRQLDPSNENDQEVIARQFLQASQFGSQEEIDEEIQTWKDLNVLGKKANQFKPKLDKMQEQIVAQELVAQEHRKAQQEEAAQTYVQNVIDALTPGELSGVKLDKKLQNQLYHSLTAFQYPSMNGRPTNLLGHLLEKYQFQQPNYQLLAEATWLLSDPEGYRSSVSQKRVNEETTQTARKLRTEEARKQSGSQAPKEQAQSQNPTRKIIRPTGIFKR